MAHAFPYLTAKSLDISSVGVYVPTRFLFCKWRGCIARVGSKVKSLIVWTRVHGILHQRTCCKKGISEVDRTTYLTPRGISRSSRLSSNRRPWDDRHQTAKIFRDQRHYTIIQYASDGRNCSQSWRRTLSNHDRWIFIRRTRSIAMGAPCGSRSNLHQTTDGGWTRTTIVTRSWPDRGAIRAWSCHDRDLLQRGIVSTRSDGVQRMTRTTIVAWSWYNWRKN